MLELSRKSMHYNVKAVPDTFLGKTVLKNSFGYMKLTATCLKNKTEKIKNTSLLFILSRRVLPYVFCGKLDIKSKWTVF